MDKSSVIKRFRSRLENVTKYSEIWEVVKAAVEHTLNKRRRGMMLFLDDLPLRLGAYHPVGTNNIILNRRLVEIVEASTRSDRVVNALIFNLLTHEYLHALGKYPEREVISLVYDITKECFGSDHITTRIAEKSPWALLKGIPLKTTDAPRRVMEIVKDFEEADRYIV